jgi:hypothetical protein
MQFRASLFASSKLDSSNAFAIAKKKYFFILVYGRRSKMVNLCIVQFPGQSSNAIRVLLIFLCNPPRTFVSVTALIIVEYLLAVSSS